MILGIDPRNDYAFKRVFGNEDHPRVLVHILNAVLKPPADQLIVSVEFINPALMGDVIDEKLSILDVRARDQSGQQFNIEMQMSMHAHFHSRFLYYWARLHGSQLERGDDYGLLRPTISICFVDGVLFRDVADCHLSFALIDQHHGVRFVDQIQFHVFQLPNFQKTADELEDALEMWLYFLNNGREMDTDAVPQNMSIPEMHEALEILEMCNILAI